MSDSFQVDLLDALAGGGPLMIALAFLSFFLYRSVLSTLFWVYQVRIPKVLLDLPEEAYERTLIQFRKALKQRLQTAGMLIAASPLVGLLGTVMGMLSTFDSLAQRSGQDTASQVADGVSMALITTQTGLTIAIPALFCTYWINRISSRRESEYFEFLGTGPQTALKSRS